MTAMSVVPAPMSRHVTGRFFDRQARANCAAMACSTGKLRWPARVRRVLHGGFSTDVIRSARQMTIADCNQHAPVVRF